MLDFSLPYPQLCVRFRDIAKFFGESEGDCLALKVFCKIRHQID